MGIQYRLGQCAECFANGKEGEVYIVNRKHMLCQYHNQIRLSLAKPKKKLSNNIAKNRSSKTFDFCTEWGFTKEIEMFVWIYRNRPHISQISGKPITLSPICFLHVLAKGLGQYPHYRFNPNNIILGTAEEHDLIDAGDSDQRARYKKNNPQADFEGYYKLREKLRVEYRDRFG